MLPELNDRKREAFAALIDALSGLRRENHELLHASLIKETIKRKKPSFDESYYGYRSFSHLLEDADNHAVVDIERNPKSGTYVVTRFGNEPRAAGAAGSARPSLEERERERGGARRGRAPAGRGLREAGPRREGS
jgi:hypothetical protein